MNIAELKFELIRLKAQLHFAKGNWGHSGRPGLIGGSSSGGGGGMLGQEEVKKIKVKDKENQWEIQAKGIPIANITMRRDFVKAKETDRLRTKMANISDLVWEEKGLSKLFGDNSITTGMHSPWSPPKDFHHSYGNRHSITSEEVREYLNRHIQSKQSK